MIATALLVLATWLVLGAVVAYVLLAWGMRRTDREARADLDAELRDLIANHRT